MNFAFGLNISKRASMTIYARVASRRGRAVLIFSSLAAFVIPALALPSTSASAASTADTVIATIELGVPGDLGNPGGVAGADGFAYVSDYLRNLLLIIDTSSNTVVSTIPVGDGPEGVAVVGQKVYAVNRIAGTVSVVDLSMNPPRITTVTDAGFQYPVAIAIANGFAFVTNYGGGLSVINTSSDQVVGGSIQVGNSPVGVAVAGGFAYVVNHGSNNVSVVDLSLNPPAVVETIVVGHGPYGIAITGNRAYVTNAGGNTVSIIDTTSNQVVETVNLGSGSPAGLAIVGGFAYLALYGSNAVAVLDLATNAIVGDRIPVGEGPAEVAFTDGNLYVTNSEGVTVSVISIGGSATTDSPASWTTEYQAYPLPESGVCTGVTPDQDKFAEYGSGVTGGWRPSWQFWPNQGRGGPVCQRTLTHVGRNQWIVNI